MDNTSSFSQIPIARVIPEALRCIFKYSSFNNLQAEILSQLLDSDENVVVAAPTGSGKTVIHELAIVRQILTRGKSALKCVLITPNKALCQQRVNDWTSSFGRIGVIVAEITGDIDTSDCLKSIAKANIIITTPEKWDSITRGWRQHLFLIGTVHLLLIDEVHHVGEDRGATLEVVICRMRNLNQIYEKRMQEARVLSNVHERSSRSTASPCNEEIRNSTIRIVALSATLPNVEDIGEWLHCKPEFIHYFDETYRPVPLEVQVISYGSAGNNLYLFDKSLDGKVADVIRQFSDGKQVLIFCSSKKATEILGQELSKTLRLGTNAATSDFRNLQDAKLQNLIRQKIAYHHSGLPPDDRDLVEKMFISGLIRVLCSTTTLAHGINLPAHLVIVKGTSCWRGAANGYQRINRSDIIQMLGRAGRAGYDSYGRAVIMTSNEDKPFYENVNLQANVVESQLQGQITEALCAEITQNMITDMLEAIDWIKTTYFFVRVKKHPRFYGFAKSNTVDDLNHQLDSICQKSINALLQSEIISINNDTCKIEPKHAAFVMTRFVLKFATMERVLKIPIDATIPRLIEELSHCEELHQPLRRQDKAILNDAMKKIKYPLKVKVQESWHKTYVLLQASAARIVFVDFSNRVEQGEITEKAIRIISAVRDLSYHNGLGKLLESAIFLDRALKTRQWGLGPNNKQSPNESIFYQCPGLTADKAIVTNLCESGIWAANEVIGLSESRICRQAQCSNNDAKRILDFAAYCLANQVSGSAYLVKDLTQSAKFTIQMSLNNYQNFGGGINPKGFPDVTYQVLAYHTSSCQLVCYRQLTNIRTNLASNVEFTASVASDTKFEDIRCLAIASIAAMDVAISGGIAESDNEQNPSATEVRRMKAKGKDNFRNTSSIPEKEENDSFNFENIEKKHRYRGSSAIEATHLESTTRLGARQKRTKAETSQIPARGISHLLVPQNDDSLQTVRLEDFGYFPVVIEKENSETVTSSQQVAVGSHQPVRLPPIQGYPYASKHASYSDAAVCSLDNKDQRIPASSYNHFDEAGNELTSEFPIQYPRVYENKQNIQAAENERMIEFESYRCPPFQHSNSESHDDIIKISNQFPDASVFKRQSNPQKSHNNVSNSRQPAVLDNKSVNDFQSVASAAMKSKMPIPQPKKSSGTCRDLMILKQKAAEHRFNNIPLRAIGSRETNKLKRNEVMKIEDDISIASAILKPRETSVETMINSQQRNYNSFYRDPADNKSVNQVFYSEPTNFDQLQMKERIHHVEKQKESDKNFFDENDENIRDIDGNALIELNPISKGHDYCPPIFNSRYVPNYPIEFALDLDDSRTFERDNTDRAMPTKHSSFDLNTNSKEEDDMFNRAFF